MLQKKKCADGDDTSETSGRFVIRRGYLTSCTEHEIITVLVSDTVKTIRNYFYNRQCQIFDDNKRHCNSRFKKKACHLQCSKTTSIN